MKNVLFGFLVAVFGLSVAVAMDYQSNTGDSEGDTGDMMNLQAPDYGSGEGTGMNGSGDAMSGENLSGGTMSGDAMSGDVMSGENLSGDTMSGDVMSGDVMSGENMEEAEMDMNPDFADTVLPWLHDQGLTMYDNVDDFRADDSITRGEAAKFVNQYAQVLGLDQDYDQCEFSDIDEYDYTLVPHIYEACKFGLLKGSQGKFMPEGNVSPAQAITIVVRTLDGFMDETGDLWYSEYFKAGQELGIITYEPEATLDSLSISRAKMGTWFYLAAMIHAGM